MGDTELVGDSAAIDDDHVHAVVGQWEIPSQCVCLQLSNKITYFLWAGDGRYRVSVWSCSYPAISRTRYSQVTGDIKSVSDSATIQQDHVLPVGKHSMCDSVIIQQDHVQAMVGRWEIQN
jgi:hypothetical protein